MSTKVSHRLHQLPVFSTLPPRALEKANALMTPISFPAGRVLCREGEVGREAFIILSGTARVERACETIAKVGPGDIVGERALLGAGFRNATIVTDEPLTAYVMTRREFASLLALPGVSRAVDVATAGR